MSVNKGTAVSGAKIIVVEVSLYQQAEVPWGVGGQVQSEGPPQIHGIKSLAIARGENMLYWVP